ncbi:ribosome-associated protein [Caldicellulosiruptor bescii]|uniref:Ribosomal silencing factor RsfS n=3 Tax=Caldicellulosiruptor TaxID=44000 RepID=B9MRP9_CALBD|nr:MULTISPECIES: ribosome silencing factor [Caldicellulosiruptor]ACM60353.1 iojap-like protein [Caldicellulosiruptor bescii DSM 6725]ADQ46303.1 iojap-like protein [Caldicellulosiruptor kronotskyensis 2002]PBC87767.1 ribosome-associated protein [Caldicellulosiruptor bescii]PBC90699.1 ribosome-associated protein [Caldicellulosiruptor bescii]PBD03868.1 ribosome-associated protein [Caldicellulosiruptor bescii]
MEQKIYEIVKLLSDKKAQDIVVLDISKLTIIADYFIICSASNVQHVKAIVDEIEEKEPMHILRIEGKESFRWVVIDFGDIILHIFHEKEREFYNLERLWIDAQKVEIAAL